MRVAPAFAVVLCLASIFMLQALAPGVDAGDGRRLIVPKGQVVYVAGPVLADEIIVGGELRPAGPGEFELVARYIAVYAGGRIVGFDGPRGTAAVAAIARASDGVPGGSVHLHTEELNVATDGYVAGGSGGAGGYASGTAAAYGGNGARGGSVVVRAESPVIAGALVSGKGGDGGHADVDRAGALEPVGIAVGGHGGDAGDVLVNGKRSESRIPPLPAPSSSSASTDGPNAVCIQQVCEPVSEIANGLLAFVDETKEDTIKEIVQLVNGFGEPMPNPQRLGLPGFPGLFAFEFNCTGVHGTDGSPNLLGNGGVGGDGCWTMRGKTGGNGQDGRSGTWTCTPGGAGGPGGDATAGETTGGNGGLGLRYGGRGGNAYTLSFGGAGGNGGYGGNWTGSDCPGGKGGDGGNAVSRDSRGGDGGNGILCRGGLPGTGNSNAYRGIGGDGRDGAPDGLDGEGFPGIALNGNSGFGPGTC